jgi:hypothetical protein
MRRGDPEGCSNPNRSVKEEPMDKLDLVLAGVIACLVLLLLHIF